MDKRILTPFRRINAGGCPREVLTSNVQELRASCFRSRMMMEDSSFEVLQNSREADLVYLSLFELGFVTPPKTTDFNDDRFLLRWSIDNLDGQWLSQCESEYLPRLHTQCAKIGQNGERICIYGCMPTIKSLKTDSIFGVEDNGYGTNNLVMSYAAEDQLWPINTYFCFELRPLSASV